MEWIVLKILSIKFIHVFFLADLPLYICLTFHCKLLQHRFEMEKDLKMNSESEYFHYHKSKNAMQTKKSFHL